MKRETKLVLIVILASIFLFILYGQLRSCNYDNELSKDGEITIGKLDSIQKFPKRSYIHLSYYIQGKKHSSSESALDTDVHDADIGKFYKIKYLMRNPEIVRGIYSQQVIDTVIILKAGFSKEDL